MGKRRILTVVLAMIVAFGLAACGGGNKPAETDAANPETTEITEETKEDESKEDESKEGELEVKETETEEPQPKIPENATEFLLTNPKIQAQASFYLPNEAKEWEIQCLNKKDPVNVPQRYVYKSENADGTSLRMDIRLTATGTEKLAEMLAAATNIMKNDPDTYYQKSLDLLETLLNEAQFREPVDSWFE